MQQMIFITTGAQDTSCDFCSSKEVVVAYLIADFVLARWHWASEGAFAACKTCMKLIETGQQVALERRAFDTMIALHGRILPDELMQAYIHELHVEFWKRLGMGRTYGDA